MWETGKSGRPLRAAFLGAWALIPAPAFSQPSPSPPPPPAPSKLAVHGYLTQAAAVADGGQILGIPEDPTTDYRTMALQFRYSMSAKDTFVAQLSHERFGRSPFAPVKPDVELDWVFYERRFSDSTSLKVGKVQIPLGIYNEVRDVGTLLPFYRPPFNFYGEGAFSSETVDGLVLSHAIGEGRRWNADVDAYWGGFDLIEVNPASAQVARGRASDDVGFQVWVTTPLSGLRVGGGASRLTLRDELLAPPEPSVTVKQWHVEVDGSFDRFVTRAEFERISFPPGRYRAYNLHLGVKVTSKLTANAQADFADLEYTVPFTGPTFDDAFSRDYALGVNWSFRSNLVLKLEGHWTEGYRLDDPVNMFVEEPRQIQYAILSLSTSF